MALYVIEVAEARMAAVKRAALMRFYGVRETGAPAYFAAHERPGGRLEHHRAMISAYRVSGTDSRLLADAAQVLRARVTLLDGIAVPA